MRRVRNPTVAPAHRLPSPDLFHNMLARFSTQDFEAAGLNADDRFLIEHMADQEIGHAIAITNVR